MSAKFEARYQGMCPCGNRIRRGDQVAYIDDQLHCAGCLDNPNDQEPTAAQLCQDCRLEHAGECF
jgi:hypothetical protein